MPKVRFLEGMGFGLAAAALVFLATFLLASQLYKSPGPAPAAFVQPTALGATGADAGAENGAASAGLETAADTPAAGGIDLAAGQAAFKACKACHTADKGGKAMTGPNLWGVVGRPAASNAGFKYSDALTALAGQPWDAAALDAYLTSPKAYAKGTKMTFAGLKKPGDRANLIAWLGMQSDTPAVPEGLDLVAASTGTAEPVDPFAALADDAVIDITPIPYPPGVTYANAPTLTEAELAAIEAKVVALEALLPTLDYERARHHPMHFPPQIDTASSAECLVCHQEILTAQPRATSPAGLDAAASLAWYQTLDTYAGAQSDFHVRHISGDYAQQVMKLECTFCHKGNDPREESPDMMPGRDAFSASATPEFTLRKMVNPSETCLLCHGTHPAENMGLEGKWHDIHASLETPEAPNGCLSCHAENFRTNRHNVNYLNAANIEDIARNGTSDSCYGCHGGRAWYRIPYPYPRTPWPGMDTTTVPDWAKDRPTASKPEHQLPPAP
ncbi:cytochrome c family protein [Rhodobacter sp. Har01]|uniref:c-type cytochrome n=1 Tax=Rhodobacter sp. Har01 TaxID=2883999 RepID=UPI001D07BD3E|nr:cytochrome c family protein [Rhodobacter sp. Har01]MCB6179105.1 cytochrome c family protein [Rhodobacter sp. Har01]